VDVLAANNDKLKGPTSWVYLNGLTGKNSMVGYYSYNSLHVYSRVTCPGNSYIVGGTCHICPIGQQPRGNFSATDCAYCEPGHYGTYPRSVM
jgi:hypothetical protein